MPKKPITKSNTIEKLIATSSKHARDRLYNHLGNIEVNIDKVFHARVEDVVLGALGMKRDYGGRVEMMPNHGNPTALAALREFTHKKMPLFLEKAWERLVPNGKVPAAWTEGVETTVRIEFKHALSQALLKRVQELAEAEARKIVAGLSLDDLLKIEEKVDSEESKPIHQPGLLE